MMPRKIIIMTEGQGDLNASKTLVHRLLENHNRETQSPIYVHTEYRVGEIWGLIKNNHIKFKRLLHATQKEGADAVLLLLDGDRVSDVGSKKMKQCIPEIARTMTNVAIQEGAGKCFSFASVFAVREFESWLIAGSQGVIDDAELQSRGIKDTTLLRNAEDIKNPKEFLGKFIYPGYSPTRHQAQITKSIDLSIIELRSFDRLKNALNGIADAFQNGVYHTSPL